MPKSSSGIKRSGSGSIKESDLTLAEIADDIQGKRWTKGEHDRLYMSGKDIGYSSFDGTLDKWDNMNNVDMSLVNRELQTRIGKDDIGYINLKTGEFIVPETSNRLQIIERMKYRVEQARQANEGRRYTIEREYRQVTLPDGRVKKQSRATSEGFKKIYEAPYGTEFSVKGTTDSVTGAPQSRRYVVTFGNVKGSKGLQRITNEGNLAPAAIRIPIESESSVRKLFAKDERITIHTKKIYRETYMTNAFTIANREKNN